MIELTVLIFSVIGGVVIGTFEILYARDENEVMCLVPSYKYHWENPF